VTSGSKWWRALGTIVVLLSCVASVGPLLALLFVETIPGRVVMLFCFALCGLPLAVWFRFYAPAGSWRRQGFLVLNMVVLVVLAIWAVAMSPTGQPRPGSRFASRFPAGEATSRFSPLNIFPETDQMALAIRAAPLFDPILAAADVKHVLSVIMPSYRAMAADPEYRALGSVLGSAVAELAGGEFRNGHVYEYVPPHRNGERMPAVLFLHGSGGNFKTYLWGWRRFADRYHCVVVLPSFGFGNWRKAGGVAAIEAAREHALRDLPVDPDRLYLIGLSNGGTGVSRAGGAFPSHYRGLGFISGVIDVSTEVPEFEAGWKHRPILVVYGGKDDRIPARYTREAAEVLRGNGADVRTRLYARRDHFLFMAELDSVLADVAGWMEVAPR